MQQCAKAAHRQEDTHTHIHHPHTHNSMACPFPAMPTPATSRCKKPHPPATRTRSEPSLPPPAYLRRRRSARLPRAVQAQPRKHAGAISIPRSARPVVHDNRLPHAAWTSPGERPTRPSQQRQLARGPCHTCVRRRGPTPLRPRPSQQRQPARGLFHSGVLPRGPTPRPTPTSGAPAAPEALGLRGPMPHPESEELEMSSESNSSAGSAMPSSHS